MAKRIDPVTGLEIDDGLPVDPNAPPEGIATPDDTVMQTTQAPGSGARAAVVPLTPEGNVPVQIASAPRPLSETTVTRQQQVKGEDVVKAEADLRAARAATDAAQPQLTEVEGQEDQLKAEAERQKAQEKAAQKEKERLAEEERIRFVETARAADKLEIEQEKKKQLASGNAVQSYWEGRPGAQLFSDILQAIGGALHFASGGEGDSPVARRLKQYQAAHEKRLVTDWEATKEANAKKKADREGYEMEIGKRRIAAANQSLLSIDLIDAELNQAIAGLSPEKRKAAQAIKDSTLKEARAEEDRKAGQAYDQLKKSEQVNRVMPAGADAKATAAAEKVKVTVGGKDFTVRGSEAEPGRVRDKAAATESLTRQLNDYDKLLAEGANPLTTGTRRAEIKGALGALTGSIKESKQLGALDNGVQKLVNAIVGDPLAIESIFEGGAEGARARVRAAKTEAQNNLADTLVTHGNDPALVREALSSSGGAAESKKVTQADLDKMPIERARAMYLKANKSTKPEHAKDAEKLRVYLKSKNAL